MFKYEEYQYLLGKVSTYKRNRGKQGVRGYQYLLGKVSTYYIRQAAHSRAYQYLLGKVSTNLSRARTRVWRVSISIR